MRTIAIAAIFGTFISATSCIDADSSQAKLKGDQASDLLTQRKCLDVASAELHQFRRLQNLWLGDNESHLGVTKSYVSLSQSEVKAIEDLKNIFAQNYGSSDSLTELSKKIVRLDQRQSEVLSIWNQVVNDEVAFIRSLWEIERGIDGLAKNLENTLSFCGNTVVKDHVSNALGELKGWSENLLIMRASIMENQSKRPRILSKLISGIRLKLQADYALKAGMEIKDLERKIVDAIAVSALLDDLQFWWVHKSYIGRGLEDTVNLKYFVPLRALTVDLAKIDEFEIRQKTIPPSELVNSEVIPKLNSYRKLITERHSDLQKKGWQGQLERQKFLVTKRKEIMNQFSEKCRMTIARFEEETKNDVSLQVYANATNLYGKMIEECKKGEQ